MPHRRSKKEKLESLFRSALDDQPANDEPDDTEPRSINVLKQVFIVGRNQVVFTGDINKEKET